MVERGSGYGNGLGMAEWEPSHMSPRDHQMTSTDSSSYISSSSSSSNSQYSYENSKKYPSSNIVVTNESKITTIIASIYSLLFEKTIFSLSYSTHSINSLFGWYDSYWRFKLIGFGFINGVLCQAGFNFAVSISIYLFIFICLFI